MGIESDLESRINARWLSLIEKASTTE